MLSIFDSIRSINMVTAVIRMLLSFVCGTVIGLERSSKNRPAGFRTHILVCIAATTAAMTGHYIYLNMQLPADPTRISSQIITGLGFLGAGTIIVTRRQTVKGLTTAAGLWSTGIVGLAFGAGFYEGGILCTLLIILIQTWLSSLGRFIHHPEEFSITVQYGNRPALDHLLRYCKSHRLAITGLRITGFNDEDVTAYTAVVSLRPNSVVDYEMLIDQLSAISGIIHVSLKKIEQHT